MASMKVKINGTWQECGFGIEGSSPTPTPPTPDGKVHLIVEFSLNSPSNRLTMQVQWWQSISGGSVINWGDGTTDTALDNTVTLSHTYAQPGRYEITIEATSGYIEFRSRITGDTGYQVTPFTVAIKEAYLWGVLSVSDAVFQNCPSLEKVVFDDSLTSIGAGSFSYCNALKQVTIPGTITSLGNSAFRFCNSAGEFHVLATTPPTHGTYTFGDIPSDCKIYVPSSVVEDYKTAWSAYASRIYGE